MRKQTLFIGLTAFTLLFSSLSTPVYGAELSLTQGDPFPQAPVLREAEDTTLEITYLETIHISTAEDLLTLSDSCRLDSWSRDRLILLENDIDLSGIDFAGIPTFGGTWEGNGHTIRGLSLTKEGNIQGLFRYLQSTAILHDLHVEGEIHPTGTGSMIGGLAGTNAGQILKCSFTGSVSGSDYIGGLVGNNEVTAIIEDCQVSGTIHGSHFTGGIAGDNHGVIRYSENHAKINTTAAENSVSLSDITLENLTNSEAAYTATDMGGIAGTSSGVIRSCKNYGNVGYQSMSYNAGGIVGSLTGFLTDCENYGVIYARKDVGGIAGQLEPSNKIEYDEDTLQILSGQLDSLGSLAHRTNSHAASGSKEIDNHLSQLQSQSSSAQNALDTMLGQFIPDGETPDPDTLTAARSDLGSSLNDMAGTMEGLNNSLTVTTGNLLKDIKAMTKQIQGISSTLSHAEENLGATLTDISDLDTDEDTLSKIAGCRNYGLVHADQNVGGIVGTIGLENDLDPEDDVNVTGDFSLNLSYETRAVTRDCRNEAAVFVKKQNAGGIVGNMSMGAVLDCINLGKLDASAADRVGGIAGSSSAILRRCDVKCDIIGGTQVGGIAGIGSTVTDCRSLTMIQNDGPEIGAVLGSSDTAMSLQATLAEEARTVSHNIYLAPGIDPGAIDGISYDGCAQPVTLTDFLALEDLPEYFTTMTIRFVCEGQEDITFRIPLGESFPMDQIPPVPPKDLREGTWEGLANTDLSEVWFDHTFTAVYEAYEQTLQTSDTRENALPVLLATGAFPPGSEIQISSTAKSVTLPEGAALLESWQIALQTASDIVVHYQPSESIDLNADTDFLGVHTMADSLEIHVQDAKGTWTKREAAIEGRYLVFPMAQDETTFCLIQLPVDHTPIYLAAIGASALIILILMMIVIRNMRKNKGTS